MPDMEGVDTITPKDIPIFEPNCINYTNLVSTCDVNVILDLVQLTQLVGNVQYNKKVFGAVVMRLYNPKCVCLIFSTGNIVTVGTNQEEVAVYGGVACVRFLKQRGIQNISMSRFVIHNRASTIDLGTALDIIGIQKKYSGDCTFTAEGFASLAFKIPALGITITMPPTGKLICTGATTDELTLTACRVIKKYIAEFQMPHGSQKAIDLNKTIEKARERGRDAKKQKTK
ncbi:MAG: hypothetical protein ACTSUE_03660 [Promethearchaeota archaeon]